MQAMISGVLKSANRVTSAKDFFEYLTKVLDELDEAYFHPSRPKQNTLNDFFTQEKFAYFDIN